MRDTTEMAREAGFSHPVPSDGYMGLAYDRREGRETGGSLKAFEALVRADERNRTWTQEHWTEYERRIAEAEREACAQVCDEQRRTIECLMVGIDDTTTPVIARIGKLVVALETADYALSAWQRGADADDYYRECSEVAAALQTARRNI